jgi:hypothetical protein
MDTPKITIKMLIENYDKELGEVIRCKLSDKIREIAPDVNVKLERAEEYYYANQGLTECHFCVYAQGVLALEKVAALFDITWDIAFKKKEVLRNNVKFEYEDKDALWYRSMDDKVFLHENVFWVRMKSNGSGLDMDCCLEDDLIYDANSVKPRECFYINFVLLMTNYTQDLKDKILLKMEAIVRRFEPETYIEVALIEKDRRFPGTTEICFNLYLPLNSDVNVKTIMDEIVARYIYFPPDEDDGHDEAIWSEHSSGGTFLCKYVKSVIVCSAKGS